MGNEQLFTYIFEDFELNLKLCTEGAFKKDACLSHIWGSYLTKQQRFSYILSLTIVHILGI